MNTECAHKRNDIVVHPSGKEIGKERNDERQRQENTTIDWEDQENKMAIKHYIQSIIWSDL